MQAPVCCTQYRYSCVPALLLSFAQLCKLQSVQALLKMTTKPFSYYNETAKHNQEHFTMLFLNASLLGSWQHSGKCQTNFVVKTRAGRHPAFLTRQLLQGLKRKKSLWTLEEGRAAQQGYAALVKLCREQVRRAKAQLELILPNALKDNENVFINTQTRKCGVRRLFILY